MRLSDLLKVDAVTEAGDDLGHVHDVRFRSAKHDPVGWRIDSLVVGPRSFAERLGYARGVVRGPGLLGAVLRWLGRKGIVIPWDAVVEVAPHRITVRGARDDFDHARLDDDGVSG